MGDTQQPTMSAHARRRRMWNTPPPFPCDIRVEDVREKLPFWADLGLINECGVDELHPSCCLSLGTRFTVAWTDTARRSYSDRRRGAIFVGDSLIAVSLQNSSSTRTVWLDPCRRTLITLPTAGPPEERPVSVEYLPSCSRAPKITASFIAAARHPAPHSRQSILNIFLPPQPLSFPLALLAETVEHMYSQEHGSYFTSTWL
jgi:hypothetical protein